MVSNTEWQGLPYHPISQFYRKTFGDKVYKIPVTTAETCPNREGLKGMKTCNFCDVWGSAAYPEYQALDLKTQIETARDRVRRRVNAEKFLVYFQAYTTTFARVAKLREQFEIAASYPEVVGVVVGTRPDCISDALFDLWNEFSDRFHVAVEFGVQTFDEDQLLWMRRGHTAFKSVQAILRTAEKTRVNLGIHLIFGSPGETDRQLQLSAELCNILPISNVKLHNLHVLKNTPLADDYARGQFQPLDLSTYAHRVQVFLQHLRPDLPVHRLSALASRHDELVAPDWTNRKMETYQGLIDYLNQQNAYQGQHYSAPQGLINPYEILQQIRNANVATELAVDPV